MFLTTKLLAATIIEVSFLGDIIIQVAVNALSLLAADYFVPGVQLEADFLTLLKITAILTAFNIFLKPLLRLALGPFILLTFGLFMIVINAIGLWLVTYFMSGLQFATPLALLESALIFSIGNFAITLARKAK
jgi:putative membrane protein